MKTRACLAVSTGLLLGSGLHAQNLTFPSAWQKFEGNSGLSIPFSFASGRMQIATSEAKRPFVARRIAFRRSGKSTGTLGFRSLQITIDVGPTDYTKLQRTYSKNFVAAPTRAVNNQLFHFPDWSKQSASFPAPFDTAIAFTKPYVHNGRRDFLVDLRSDGTGTTGWGNTDAVMQTFNGDSIGPSRKIGVGCRVGPNEMSCQAQVASVGGGARMRVWLSISQAPLSSPAIFFYGLSRTNLRVPGVCTSIYTSAEFSRPLGRTDRSGNAFVFISPPGRYQASLVGLHLFGQAVAGNSLSHGRELVMPPVALPAITSRMAFAFSSRATAGPGFQLGGLVFQVSSK